LPRDFAEPVRLFMPNNRIIYWGIVVLVATVLLWIGAELTKRIAWALPYAGSIGVLMIMGGFIYELWKSRAIKSSPFKKDEKKD
jgi:hypothetical protein